MRNLRNVILDIKQTTRGASCYQDIDTGQTMCVNGLTLEEAKIVADRERLILKSWNQGKTCSQISCG